MELVLDFIIFHIIFNLILKSTKYTVHTSGPFYNLINDKKKKIYKNIFFVLSLF